MEGFLCAGLVVGDVAVSPVSADIMSRDSDQGVREVGFYSGGDAANVATAISRLGGRARLKGAIGRDLFGGELEKRFSREGVEARLVRTDACTAVSVALCEPDGERHFAYCGGANDLFCEEMVTDADLEGCGTLFVGSAMALKNLDGAGLSRLFRRAKEKGCRTALDCTHDREGLGMKKLGDALLWTDVFVPSYGEAAALTGKKEPEEMAEALAGFGLGVFGVKLGAEGCYLTDFEREVRVPAFRTKIADTIGAGDCFMAGFLFAHAQGADLRTCGEFACATAKFGIERHGATAGVPGAEQVRQFLRKARH